MDVVHNFYRLIPEFCNFGILLNHYPAFLIRNHHCNTDDMIYFV